MRAPASILAEIAWRWTFGVALWAVLYYSFREYFATVEISRAEYVALRSLAPSTWMAITVRVMVALVTGLRVIGPIIIPALLILWIALATIGRVATIRALSDADPSTNWLSTIGLHAFRVTLAFAALLAFFGSGILIDALVGDPREHFAAVLLLVTVALLLIALAWSVVNWFFSLAAIFTARDHTGFFASLRETTRLYRRESDALYRSGFSFGVLRTVLFVAVTVLSLMIAVRFSATRPLATVLPMIAISLPYFAVADAITLWRLATYISLTEPEPPVVAAPEPPIQPVPEPRPAPEPEATAEAAPVIPADEPAPNNQ